MDEITRGYHDVSAHTDTRLGWYVIPVCAAAPAAGLVKSDLSDLEIIPKCIWLINQRIRIQKVAPIATFQLARKAEIRALDFFITE